MIFQKRWTTLQSYKTKQSVNILCFLPLEAVCLPSWKFGATMKQWLGGTCTTELGHGPGDHNRMSTHLRNSWWDRNSGCPVQNTIVLSGLHHQMPVEPRLILWQSEMSPHTFRLFPRSTSDLAQSLPPPIINGENRFREKKWLIQGTAKMKLRPS